MVKRYGNHLLLIASLICCSTLHGQREQGLETDSFYYGSAPWKVLSIDTSLSSIYNFDFASAFNSFFVDLGNTGSPLQNMTMQHQPLMHNLEWQSHAHGLSPYRMPLDSIQWYKTKKPFSQIAYAIGAERQNVFSVQHSQRVNLGLDYGLSFYRMSSIGYYPEEETRNAAFSLYNRWASNRGRYSGNLTMNFHRLRRKANGGIQEDFIGNDSLRLSSPSLYTPVLDGAIQSDRGFNVCLESHLNFGFETFRQVNDSLQVSAFQVQSLLGHKLAFSTWSNRFDDPQSGDDSLFYASYAWLDADTFRFSYQSKVLENSLFWRRHLAHRGGILEFEAGHRYIPWSFQGVDQQFHESFTQIRYILQKNQWLWENKAHLIFSGYQRGSQHLVSALHHETSLGFIHVEASFLRNVMNPVDRLADPTYTGGFQVNSRPMTFEGRLTYGLGKNIVLSGHYILDRNPVLVDSNRLTFQFNGSVHRLAGSLSYSLSALNGWLNWDALMGAQMTSEDVYVMPTFYTRHRIYAQQTLFQSRLILNLGAQVTWNTAFPRMTYDPYLSRFGLPVDREASAMPPRLEAFLGIKVSHMRVFIRAQYLNQYLGPTGYYGIAQYPARPRNYTGGLVWRFFE